MRCLIGEGTGSVLLGVRVSRGARAKAVARRFFCVLCEEMGGVLMSATLFQGSVLCAEAVLLDGNVDRCEQRNNHPNCCKQ